MRLCKDCRWTRRPGNDHQLVRCDHPTSRLNERGHYQRMYCFGARLPGMHCGPDGKYWESIEEPNRKGPDRRVSGIEPSNINDVVVEL